VELAGHTAWNRLPLLNLHPAPIQVSWLGYPHSTGLPSVDYRITDTIADPPGVSDRLHTEQLVRLPKTFICYRPPDDFEPFRALPYQRNGYITFGSFNNFAKVSPATIKCWRQILTMMPDSKLLLKSAVFAEEDACRMIAERLDIPLNRLVMIGSTPDRTSHLALYSQVDIALDTFPYNGTTTTCEALYMGVPVITISGDHHAARVGASILGTVGVGELVASSVESYIDKTVKLACDIPRLVWLREHLPGLMANSPLMDQEGFTIALESAYQQMWQHFIDG
jgi:predicted O-linked N-acetylglucosamine transferase (SPINDLY family)